MGRLRDGYDSPLWRSVSEEVIDLFGNEDGVLHRQGGADACATRDALWDEPTGSVKYEEFKIPFLIQDWQTPIDVDDSGFEQRYEATIFVTRAHLDKAGVPKDGGGDQIRPGDVLECWFKGDRIFWGITGVDRQGFVNDSDYWTGYILTASRTTKFVPERDL